MAKDKGRWFQNDGRTDQPGRADEQSAPTGDDGVRWTKIGSALARTIEDQQLMLGEGGFGNDGTGTA
jgi:hypothetical protein